MFVLAVGSAVNPEYGWVALAGGVTGWARHEAMDLGAVTTFEHQILDSTERNRRHECICLMSEATWAIGLQSIDFARRDVVAADGYHQRTPAG